MLPASAWKVTDDLPFRLGDKVTFMFGVSPAIGQIVEYRGPIGVGGRRLWRIEFRLDDVSDGMAVELPEMAFTLAEPNGHGPKRLRSRGGKKASGSEGPAKN